MTSIQRIRDAVFRIAKRDRVDSAEVVLALAECLALVAAYSELNRADFNLDASIDEFVQHVRLRTPQLESELVLHRGRKALAS